MPLSPELIGSIVGGIFIAYAIYRLMRPAGPAANRRALPVGTGPSAEDLRLRRMNFYPAASSNQPITPGSTAQTSSSPSSSSSSSVSREQQLREKQAISYSKKQTETATVSSSSLKRTTEDTAKRRVEATSPSTSSSSMLVKKRSIEKPPISSLTPPEQVHRLLTNIFRVRLQGALHKDEAQYILLKGVLAEIMSERKAKEVGKESQPAEEGQGEGNEEGSKLLLSEDHIDSIVFELLALRGFPFLLECLGRSLEQKKRLQQNEMLLNVVERVIMTIVACCGMEIQKVWSPAPLPSENSSLLYTVLKDASSSSTSYFGDDLAPPSAVLETFISLLCDRADEFELDKIFQPVFRLSFWELSRAKWSEPYLAVLSGLVLLTKQQSASQYLVADQQIWLPPSAFNGQLLERTSLLGVALRLSPLENETTIELMTKQFTNLLQRTQQDVNQVTETIRSQSLTQTHLLHQLFLNLLKFNTTREPTFSWIARLLRDSKPRSQMRGTMETAPSSGTVTNLTVVMIRLCLPFISNFEDQSKMKSIDPWYCCLSKRIDFASDSRLAPSEALSSLIKQRQQEFEKGEKKTWNNLSELFFLTQYTTRIGFLSLIEPYTQLNQAISRVAGRRTPEETQRFERLLAVRLAFECEFLNPETLKLLWTFFGFSASWMLRLINEESTMASSSSSSTNEGEPSETEDIFSSFAILPEWMVEGMVQFVNIVTQLAPESIDLTVQPLVSLAVRCIGDERLIKNPYIRGQLAEMLYNMCPNPDAKPGKKSDLSRLFFLIENNPTAKQHLIRSLLQLYVDIEKSGRHAQFYEKFPIRKSISVLLRHLRGIPVFYESLQKLYKESDLVLHFTHLMTNDANFLLDESLQYLEKIKAHDTEIEDKERWDALPEEEREERTRNHEANVRHAKYLCAGANETIDLMLWMSTEFPSPFLVPEMIERLGAMLNFFLVRLTGPKALDLKVKDPERYLFRPRVLLDNIIHIYLNFSNYPEFRAAIVKDGRSYKIVVFEKVVGLLSKLGIVAPEDIQRFIDFISALRQTEREIKESEDDFSDAPDEFLDPITSVLMTNPVLLPQSKQTVDRVTISRHLLSDPSDPFTRSPLSIEMVEPNIELKERIDAWLLSRPGKSSSSPFNSKGKEEAEEAEEAETKETEEQSF